MKEVEHMSNPWETGTVYADCRPAWCDSSSRIEAARKMDAATLRRCLEWPDTQKSVRQYIERRLRRLQREAMS